MTWTRRADMPVVSGLAGGAAIGSKFYVAGGRIEPNRLYEWDQAANTWATRASLPADRDSTCAAAIGTKLYVAGGVDRNFPTTDPSQVTFYEWDQVANTWTTKAPLPSGRSGGTMAAIGTKVYLAGGSASSALVSPTGDTPQDTLYEWDQASNTWATKATMPGALYFAASVVIGTKLYVIGGATVDNVTGRQSTLYEWDQATNTWATKTSMSTGRAGHSAGLLGSNVYVVSGESGSTRLDVWDSLTDTWTNTLVDNLPTSFGQQFAAYGTTSGITPGFLVAGGIGGVGSSFLSDVQLMTVTTTPTGWTVGVIRIG